MSVFIVLILDKDCRVLKAATLAASNVSQAATLASEESGKLKGWGFELWRSGKLMRASYDCHPPPARMAS